MGSFTLEVPRAVHFGRGVLDKLRPAVAGLGRRVLLVTGRGWFPASAWGTRIEDLLRDCSIHRLACPAAEPDTGSLAAAAGEASSFDTDVIVAVGGGSVMDTAKALSALLRSPGPVERFLEGMPGATAVPGPCVPWIAVPTTAGTGAEVTKNAVVRVAAAGVKRSMRSPFLLAAAVIVDPLLTSTLPLAVTGTSGLDALTQLVEAYVSRGTNSLVRSLVEGAFGPMLEALRGLPGNPGDERLREQAAYGALVSGIALANAGLGAAHGFAASVGGAFDVPHGLACAVFLPHVLEANRSVIEGDLGRLLAGVPGIPTGDAVAALAGEVTGLLHAYGLPADLRGFGIPRGRIAELAEKSSGSSMRGNPKELTMEERSAILSRVLWGGAAQ